MFPAPPPPPNRTTSVPIPALQAPPVGALDLSGLEDLASAATQKEASSSPPSKRRSEDEDLQFCFRCGKGGPVRKHRACMHEHQLTSKIAKKHATPPFG